MNSNYTLKFARRWCKKSKFKHSKVSNDQRLKEERELKKSTLDVRHYFILEIVANAVNMELSEVEDSIVEGTQIITMNRFFEENGTNKIIFFFSEPEKSDLIVGDTSKIKQNIRYRKKLFITDGDTHQLTNLSLIFLRIDTSKAINDANISNNIVFHVMSGEIIESRQKVMNERKVSFFVPDNCALTAEAINMIFKKIYIPCIVKSTDGWGDIKKSFIPVDFMTMRRKFIHSLESFSSILLEVKESVDKNVSLNMDVYPEFLQGIQSASDIIKISKNIEQFASCEECGIHWLKQIEQVLVESEQMRREADNIGPKAELEYWKKRTAKFNSLLDQIKLKRCRCNPHLK
ncbi:hypothetical protein A3Q56_01246 [Intoshia linei]|uniref:Dynein heavy chain tail domain-containing protein n=1 Tax=Intoshia linei TaxID=1819745 RepID=A0A177BBU8_9BILA|nr:hypothetical protein A3Q56_01246 [Intoshia linei]